METSVSKPPADQGPKMHVRIRCAEQHLLAGQQAGRLASHLAGKLAARLAGLLPCCQARCQAVKLACLNEMISWAGLGWDGLRCAGLA